MFFEVLVVFHHLEKGLGYDNRTRSPYHGEIVINGSNSIRERLGGGIMAYLMRENNLRGAEERVTSPDEMVQVVQVATKAAQRNRVSQLYQVMGTLEGMRTAGDWRASP